MSDFTPASLAQAWGCSDELVYGLISSGQLRAWKLGGKLWRIKPDAKEEYECRQTIGSAASLGSETTAAPIVTAPLRGLTSEDRTASRLERMIERPQRPQLVHSGQSGPSQQPIQSARS